MDTINDKLYNLFENNVPNKRPRSKSHSPCFNEQIINKSNDHVFVDPQDIVNNVATFFSNSYIAPSIHNNTTANSLTYANLIDIPLFTPEEVYFTLRQTNQILCVRYNFLTTIFNLKLKCSCFLECWKTSRVCLIRKEGKQVFENILNRFLYTSLSRLISCGQHGFMSRRCTVTNLVEENTVY